VDVVGTAGSGDCTIAGFLSALLRGLSAEDTITSAVAVGACNVEKADTLSGVRTWDETMRRVGSGWTRLELNINDASWQFDNSKSLWIAG
jgi:fructose-1-phosphate kinase PfkB-like protein